MSVNAKERYQYRYEYPQFLLPVMKLVRTVARRNTDDRTVSELIRLRDSLDRLGLLWTPFDMLDKYQSIELARNLHVSSGSGGG